MGTIRPCERVKLFCGILGREMRAIESAVDRLEELAGPADYCSLPVRFNFTDYYEAEMGPELLRVFVSFERRIDPGNLREIKIATNSLEEELAHRGTGIIRRRVNLDPGFLSLHSVVLASTKNFQHRIPVGKGIYLEQEMFFTKKEARFLPWTYPDYQSPEYVQIFKQIRQIARLGAGP